MLKISPTVVSVSGTAFFTALLLVVIGRSEEAKANKAVFLGAKKSAQSAVERRSAVIEQIEVMRARNAAMNAAAQEQYKKIKDNQAAMVAEQQKWETLVPVPTSVQASSSASVKEKKKKSKSS